MINKEKLRKKAKAGNSESFTFPLIYDFNIVDNKLVLVNDIQRNGKMQSCEVREQLQRMEIEGIHDWCIGLRIG